MLVLAPHADDEVLGCGGLLAQAVNGGARVEVLYLTDSSGGSEVVEGKEAYARRREAEAAKGLDELGVKEPGTTLPIPDGELKDHTDSAEEAIQKALDNLVPDLVLCVSPLETTADHQTAFACLYQALSGLRGGGLAEALKATRFLLYEINHPLFPDLLVDVSDQIDVITRSVEAHQSQLELHNYLEAGLGLRRYRTLTLGPDVEAAEAYRELSLNDFVTNSLGSLIAAVGGPVEFTPVEDGPKVSVVVRTKDRPTLLGQALESVAASSYRQLEVVVVNDGGEPVEAPKDFPFELRVIDLEANRGRAAAANAGIAAATGDWVCFLDDDDRVLPEHFDTLAGLTRAAGVRVAYTDAAVVVLELDGESGWAERERRLTYSRDFDPELLLFDNYIPFHTLIIQRALLAEVGPLDEELDFFEDWDLLIRLARKTAFHHLPQVTCEYRQFRGAGHHILGDRPHERADFLSMKTRLIDRYSEHQSPELLARVIDRLRGEAVELGELSDARAAEVKGLRQGLAEVEHAYHRLNGEIEPLREDRERIELERQRLNGEAEALRAEGEGLRDEIGTLGEKLQQQYDTEKELRAAVEDQNQHLQRVYAENERLQAIIEAMEASTAWKAGRALRKITGRGE